MLTGVQVLVGYWGFLAAASRHGRVEGVAFEGLTKYEHTLAKCPIVYIETARAGVRVGRPNQTTLQHLRSGLSKGDSQFSELPLKLFPCPETRQKVCSLRDWTYIHGLTSIRAGPSWPCGISGSLASRSHSL